MAKTGTTVFGGHYPLLDARLSNPRYANFAYRLPTASSSEQWDAHARWVRRRILVAAGLCPRPGRTPLNARIWDQTEPCRTRFP